MKRILAMLIACGAAAPMLAQTASKPPDSKDYLFEVKWDGLRIQANPGNDVRAVHGGRVMYADWLRGQGMLIVLDHGDRRIGAKTVTRGAQHRRRKVERDRLCPRPVDLEQRQESPIARAEVEDAPGVARHQVEQRSFALGAVRNGVGARQVGQCVLGCGPLAHVLAPNNREENVNHQDTKTPKAPEIV